LPRPCGIATFNNDLTHALTAAGAFVTNIAVDRRARPYRYPLATVGTLQQKNRADYTRVAQIINEMSPDIVLLEHEFGIYGGDEGVYVLDLLKELNVPVVSIAHTFPFTPKGEADRQKLAILTEIGRHATAVVTISTKAQQRYAALLRQANIATPVIHIPHGTPDVEAYRLENPKQTLGLSGRSVLTTFGLITSNKGIGDIVTILPQVVQSDPTTLYRILGMPHPVNPHARTYVRRLQERVKRLGLEQHVEFVSRFMTVQEIMENLQATDLYITYYHDTQQASSGTLSFAVAAGCCVVATPYIHAQELLSAGRGVLTPFGQRRTLADTIIRLLKNPQERQIHAQKAYRYGRKTTWSLIGEEYLRVLARLGTRSIPSPVFGRQQTSYLQESRLR
jgi:glycosyltransferase involved in cell wall biosynthesis